MSDPAPIISIVEGVLGLLSLIGLPVAAVVSPVTNIITGIFGLRSKKK